MQSRFILISAAVVASNVLLTPPARSTALPSLVNAASSPSSLSRRAAFTLPLAALALPLAASAKCICRTATDCECTDDKEGDAAGSIQRKRADAAGREAEMSRKEILFYRDSDAMTSDEAAVTKARGKGAKPQPKEQAKVSAGASDPRDMMVDRGSLTGFGTQNYSDIDKDAARKRFLEILFDTVAKREAEYGFELDADDIKQIEGVLRNKYCGKEGLIGPC